MEGDSPAHQQDDVPASPPQPSQGAASRSSSPYTCDEEEDHDGSTTYDNSTPSISLDDSSSSRLSSAPVTIALDAIVQPVKDQVYFYETPTHVYLLASDRLHAMYHVLTFVKHTLADVQPEAEESSPDTTTTGTDDDATDHTENDAGAPGPWPRCARLEPQSSVLTSTEAQSFVDSLRLAHESPTVRLPLRWGRAKALVGAVRFTAGYYLLLVTKRRLVARIGSHRVFEAAETELISLLQSSSSSSSAFASNSATKNSTDAEGGRREPLSGAQYLASLASAAIPSVFRRSSEEETYTRQFMGIGFHRHAFYYSHTYDLTNTLQTNMTVPVGRRERRLKYAWNEFLHEPFADLWDEDGEEGEDAEEDAEEVHDRAPKTESSPRWPRTELDPHNRDPFEGDDEAEDEAHDTCHSSDTSRRYDMDETSDDSARASFHRPAYAGEAELPMPDHFRNSPWCLAFIHGAVVQKVVWLQHRSVLLTLIGRVSREYTGARYLRRGVNSDGHVANHVEVEQIVCEESSLVRLHTCGAFSAYVQVRGSIPLHWSHAPSALPKPPIILSQHVDPAYHDTRRHFQELIADYGVPVVCMDFVKQQEKRPREVPLGTAYKHAVAQLAASVAAPPTTPPPSAAAPPAAAVKAGCCAEDGSAWPRVGHEVLAYDAMDLRRVADRAWNTVTAAAEEASGHVGFFACLPLTTPAMTASSTSSSSSTATAREDGAHQGARLVRLQHGVVRSNCVDCIDRTNVGQYLFSLHALGQQLEALGLLYAAPDLCLSPSVQELLLQMYLFMGDAIAMQYGGSAQVGAGVLHRGTGWDQWMGIQRLYHNVLGDREKQAVMNLFLGRFQPAPLFWWRAPRGHQNRRAAQAGAGRRPMFISPLQQTQRHDVPWHRGGDDEGDAQPREDGEEGDGQHAQPDARRKRRLRRQAARHAKATAQALAPRFVSRALNPAMSVLPPALMRGAAAAAGPDGRQCPPTLLPFVFARLAQRHPSVRQARSTLSASFSSPLTGGATSRTATKARASTSAAARDSVPKLLEAAYAEAGADYYLQVREAPHLDTGLSAQASAWWRGPLEWHLRYRRCATGGHAPHACGQTACASCQLLRPADSATPRLSRLGSETGGEEGKESEEAVLEDADSGQETEGSTAAPRARLVHTPGPALERRRDEVQRSDVAAHERHLCIEPPLDDLGEQVMAGGGNKATLPEVMDDGFQLELGTAVITAHVVADTDAKSLKGKRGGAAQGLDVVELVGTTRATSPCMRHATRSLTDATGMHVTTTRPAAVSGGLGAVSGVWWELSTESRTVTPPSRYCPLFAALPREVRASVYARELADRSLWRPSFHVPLEGFHDDARTPIDPPALVDAEAVGAREDAHSTILFVAHTLATQYGSVPSTWLGEHVRGALGACLETAAAAALSPVQRAAFRAEARDGAWLAQLAERYEERCDRGYWASFFLAQRSSDAPPSRASSPWSRRSRSPSRASSGPRDASERTGPRQSSRGLSSSFLRRWFASVLTTTTTTTTNAPALASLSLDGSAESSLPEAQHDGLQLLLRVTRYLMYLASGAAGANSALRAGPLPPLAEVHKAPVAGAAAAAPTIASLGRLADTLTQLLHLRDGLVHVANVESFFLSVLARMQQDDDAVRERPRLRFSDEAVTGAWLYERVQASVILPPSFLRGELVRWWSRPRRITGDPASVGESIRVNLSADEATVFVAWLIDVHVVLSLFAPSKSTAVPSTQDGDEGGAYADDPTALFCFLSTLAPRVLNSEDDTARKTTAAHQATYVMAPRAHDHAAALAESLASVALSIAQTLPHVLGDQAHHHHHAAAEGDGSSTTTSAVAGLGREGQLAATLADLDARLVELAAGLRHVDLARAVQDLEQSLGADEDDDTETGEGQTSKATPRVRGPSLAHGTGAAVPARCTALPPGLSRRDRFLLCFFANVFNALYVHAWLHALREQLASAAGSSSVAATPSAPTVPSVASRLSVAFYERHAYRIGDGTHGGTFTLSDIKYGILQGHDVRPYSGLPPFLTKADYSSRLARYVPHCLLTEKEEATTVETAGSGAHVPSGTAGASFSSPPSSFSVTAGGEEVRAGWSALFVAHARQHGAEIDTTASDTRSHTAQCAALLHAGWQLQQDDAAYLRQRLALSLVDVYMSAPFLDTAAFTAPVLSRATLSPTQPVHDRASNSLASSCSTTLTSPTTATTGQSFFPRTATATASFAGSPVTSSPAAAGPTLTTTTTTNSIDIWPTLLHPARTIHTVLEAVAAACVEAATSWRALPIFLDATVEAQLHHVEQSVVQRLGSALSYSHATPATRTLVVSPRTGPISTHATTTSTSTTTSARRTWSRQDGRVRFLTSLAATRPDLFLPLEGSALASHDVVGWLQAGHQSSRLLTKWEDEMNQLHAVMRYSAP